MSEHEHEHEPATDDSYLWSGSGRADPFVAELERTLEPLRYTRTAPRWARRGRLAIVLLAAAAVALVAGGVAFERQRESHERATTMASAVDVREHLPKPPAPAPAGGWQVAALDGAPCCDGVPIDAARQLAIGQWLETDKVARARLAVADIGTLVVDPDTRLRLVKSGASEHRIALEKGRIEARVDAPPRLFVVETPSAVAVDLGCAYSLGVDDEGTATLKVTSGWVALERSPISAYVPAGASCRTVAKNVGVPRFEDAPAALAAALDQLELDQSDAAALGAALAAARPRDSLSLWHLLVRVDRAARELVVARLTALVGPPPGQLEAIHDGRPSALEAWRRELVPAWQSTAPLGGTGTSPAGEQLGGSWSPGGATGGGQKVAPTLIDPFAGEGDKKQRPR